MAKLKKPIKWKGQPLDTDNSVGGWSSQMRSQVVDEDAPRNLIELSPETLQDTFGRMHQESRRLQGFDEEGNQTGHRYMTVADDNGTPRAVATDNNLNELQMQTSGVTNRDHETYHAARELRNMLSTALNANKFKKLGLDVRDEGVKDILRYRLGEMVYGVGLDRIKDRETERQWFEDYPESQEGIDKFFQGWDTPHPYAFVEHLPKGGWITMADPDRVRGALAVGLIGDDGELLDEPIPGLEGPVHEHKYWIAANKLLLMLSIAPSIDAIGLYILDTQTTPSAHKSAPNLASYVAGLMAGGPYRRGMRR